MANILGITGFNKKASSSNVLLAAYENDIVNVSSGLGYGLNISGNRVDFERFLDRVFVQDYSIVPKTFNGSTWSREYVPRVMTAKFQQKFKQRMYLGNCKFTAPQAPNDLDGNPVKFPSHVFHSDIFVGNALTWGIEWGQNGRTLANTDLFYLDPSDAPLIQDFIAANIQVGDPLFITSGNSQLASKYYTIAEIKSPYSLRVTEKFPVTATALHYWMGNNYFPVETDDGDEIRALGVHTDDKLLIYKILSMSYYTGNRLAIVPGALGTPSQDSVIAFGNHTYHFHGSNPTISGIYRFDGAQSILISAAIDPFIQGMNSSIYPSVIGWREGRRLRWYIGDTSNANYDISITKACATINTGTDSWDVSPLADGITASTDWFISDRQYSFCGTTDDEVQQMENGNSLNTAAMPFRHTLKPVYPEGTDVINSMKRIQIIGTRCDGVKVDYRIWDDPKNIGRWSSLGELTGDRTELVIPSEYNYGSGIQFSFHETSTNENDYFIEKITLYYEPQTKRLT